MIIEFSFRNGVEPPKSLIEEVQKTLESCPNTVGGVFLVRWFLMFKSTFIGFKSPYLRYTLSIMPLVKEEISMKL